MLSWLRRTLFASKPDVRLTRRAARFLRGKYDSALTSDNNRRHWANADGLSSNAANNPEVSRVLRNRSRYEVANNSYAKGVVLTLANDVIGTGARLQLLTEDAEANPRIELEFARWAKAIGLAEKLRTMRMACASDGEAFAILINNERLPTAIKLDLRLVEADQVTTPDLSILTRRELASVLDDFSSKAPRSANARLNLVLFRLAVCCGLRASEIAHLRISDVRIEGGRPPHQGSPGCCQRP